MARLTSLQQLSNSYFIDGYYHHAFLYKASIPSAGTAALVLARPLLTLPLTTVSIAAERDLINQLPSLPRVYDGACLTWLYFAGAATAASTNFYGSVEFAYG